MKNQNLFIVAIFTMIISCKKNEQNQITDTKKIEQDSLTSAKELADQQFKKDSLELIKIRGYQVEKISGNHKYGGSTKVEYKNILQALAEEREESAKEMRTKQDISEREIYFKTLCTGGQIRLDVERNTIGAANFEDFSIIIKDLNEKELFRYKLEADIPETPNRNDMWWNIKVTGIDKRISAPFFIYIIDDLEDAPFKFKVTPILK